MRLYEMLPDDAGSAYELDAVHRYGLPGVRCNGCGVTWSTTGVAYPYVDLPASADPSPFTSFSPVEPASFRRLAADARAWFPAGAALVPGTEFGPLEGRWRASWTTLAG